MPNPQTNIRLSPAIRERAISAANARGITLAQLIEAAISCYLEGGPGSAHDSAADTKVLATQLAALEARVSALEGRLPSAGPEQLNDVIKLISPLGEPPEGKPARPVGEGGGFSPHHCGENLPTEQARPVGEGEPPEGIKADGLQYLTTSQAWERCKGQGYQGTKDAFRSFAKRNPERLGEWGLAPLGYQGRGNDRASYRVVTLGEESKGGEP